MTARKVVINACHGGFSLSMAGERALLARKGKQAFFYENKRDASGRIDFDEYVRIDPDVKGRHFITYTLTEDLGPVAGKGALERDSYFSGREIKRDDPDLIAVVEELGEQAAGDHAKLEVVEIPGDVEWEIEEYDGLEWVAEAHRTWR